MAVIPNELLYQMAVAFFTAAKTYKMSLHTSSFVPDKDTHEYYSDLTNEVSGTGYTEGGDDIGDPTVSKDEDTDEVKIDFSDYTFSDLTIADIRYAVIYIETGVDSTSQVIAMLDFGETLSLTAEDLAVKISPHGILTLN